MKPPKFVITNEEGSLTLNSKKDVEELVFSRIKDNDTFYFSKYDSAERFYYIQHVIIESLGRIQQDNFPDFINTVKPKKGKLSRNFIEVKTEKEIKKEIKEEKQQIKEIEKVNEKIDEIKNELEKEDAPKNIIKKMDVIENKIEDIKENIIKYSKNDINNIINEALKISENIKSKSQKNILLKLIDIIQTLQPDIKPDDIDIIKPEDKPEDKKKTKPIKDDPLKLRQDDDDDDDDEDIKPIEPKIEKPKIEKPKKEKPKIEKPKKEKPKKEKPKKEKPKKEDEPKIEDESLFPDVSPEEKQFKNRYRKFIIINEKTKEKELFTNDRDEYDDWMRKEDRLGNKYLEYILNFRPLEPEESAYNVRGLDYTTKDSGVFNVRPSIVLIEDLDKLIDDFIEQEEAIKRRPAKTKKTGKGRTQIFKYIILNDNHDILLTTNNIKDLDKLNETNYIKLVLQNNDVPYYDVIIVNNNDIIKKNNKIKINELNNYINKNYLGGSKRIIRK